MKIGTVKFVKKSFSLELAVSEPVDFAPSNAVILKELITLKDKDLDALLLENKFKERKLKEFLGVVFAIVEI